MSSVIGVIDGSDEREKIEVLMVREEPEAKIHLRSLSWGEGIGWYPQKTLILNCKEVGKLQMLLNQIQAIVKTEPQKKACSRGKIIPFPRRQPFLPAVERRALKEA